MSGTGTAAGCPGSRRPGTGTQPGSNHAGTPSPDTGPGTRRRRPGRRSPSVQRAGHTAPRSGLARQVSTASARMPSAPKMMNAQYNRMLRPPIRPAGSQCSRPRGGSPNVATAHGMNIARATISIRLLRQREAQQHRQRQRQGHRAGCQVPPQQVAGDHREGQRDGLRRAEQPPGRHVDQRGRAAHQPREQRRVVRRHRRHDPVAAVPGAGVPVGHGRHPARVTAPARRTRRACRAAPPAT